jgi:hypothetical protein
LLLLMQESEPLDFAGQEWRLLLYPRGHGTAAATGHASAYLQLRSALEDSKIPIGFSIALLDANGDAVVTQVGCLTRCKFAHVLSASTLALHSLLTANIAMLIPTEALPESHIHATPPPLGLHELCKGRAVQQQ